ncbi:MAG: substrate-binding domain-containing protein [Bacteroidota bacterium]|nr:substrate-binding domain-containing protein [Bacteroidota bacterium]
MKRLFITSKISTLLVGVLFLIGGCNISSNKPKIGFLFPHLQSDRYVKEQKYFTDKIGELGGEAITAEAGADDKVQIKQASEMIEKGAKVLVLNAINVNTAAAIVREAKANKVSVIAYDRLVQNCDLDCFLSFDNEKVGKLMAEYLTKLKPEGNYILLGGDKDDQNALLVKKGQLSVLDPFLKSGKIKIIYSTFIESWSGDNARHEMEKYLDLGGLIPDAILSSYDGLSTGTIEMLKEQKITAPILFSGQDAELAACRNIVAGTQAMTVYKSVRNLAYKAAELSMKLAKKEKLTDVSTTVSNGKKDVPSVLLDPVAVDKSNLKSTVIADDFHSEKEIYNQ